MFLVSLTVLLIAGQQTASFQLSLDASKREHCPDNWIMSLIDEENIAAVEYENALWYDRLMLSLEETYTNSSKENGGWAETTKEPQDWSRFDIMMPVMDVCPLTVIGVEPPGDGGKYICGIELIPNAPEQPCVVYSIGSNNQWDFEESLYDKTNCSVFTFDCTCDGSNLPPRIKDRVFFNNICLGKDDSTDRETHKSLSSLMKMHDHSYVTLLKADIVSNKPWRKLLELHCDAHLLIHAYTLRKDSSFLYFDSCSLKKTSNSPIKFPSRSIGNSGTTKKPLGVAKRQPGSWRYFLFFCTKPDIEPFLGMIIKAVRHAQS